jgi:DNA-binding transcriptional LysR family regulator
MRELNLDQLRTLVAIVDLGTFSAAAQALHLAQPTVSLHVSELEARLGAALLLRGGRRVAATPAGTVLVQRARRLLREADDLEDTVRRHARGVSGRVRLGTSTSILAYLMPPMLEAMRAAHPDIDVEPRIVGSYDGMALLADGSLDVALLAPPDAPHGFVVSPWRRDPVMALLPASWPAPSRITPQWLAQRPLIFNDASTRLYRQSVEWFARAGIVPRVRIELNYNEAMKSLVATGWGAAILPIEGEVQPHLVPGVRAVALKPALTRETVLVHRALPQLDGAARHFVTLLRGFRQR